MLRRAASVAAQAWRVSPAAAGRLVRHARSFAASAEDPASLAALRTSLLDERDPKFPRGFAPGLRQDEWVHPGGNVSFWLLRRDSTPPTGSAQFDPLTPMGTGVNADVLASVMKQGDGVLGRASAVDGLGPVAVTSVVHQALRAGMHADTACYVALPGLCSFVAGRELWADAVSSQEAGTFDHFKASLTIEFDSAFADLDDESKMGMIEASLASARAVALGVPRPGHSVLGYPSSSLLSLQVLEGP